MRQQERWTSLLEMLSSEGRIEIEPAAARLGVSTATVRRDLDELGDQQLLVRSRGGAVPHSVSYDLPLRYRTSRHAEEKQRIAVLAASLVAPGSVVGLNGGTTTTEVGRALAVRADLQSAVADASGPSITVVTNALNIAHELAVRQHVKIVVTGGVARPQSYELTGPLATPAIEQLTLDIAVLGVDGISAQRGACTIDEGEAAVNQLIASRAHKVVVVADASKLGRHAFSRICTAAAIDVLVTSERADPATLGPLRELGVDVQLA